MGHVAVPSRVFVGLLVFGLMTSLALVPYTLLLLSGYQPAGEPLVGPDPQAFSAADKLALALACLFSLAVAVASWRALLASARRDMQRRRERQQPPPPREEQPPGYQ